MLEQITETPKTATELLGDLHPLADCIGTATGLAALNTGAASLQLSLVTDLPSLRSFLLSYQRQILVPVELPAIYQAYLHCSRGKVRELIALDQRIGQQPMLQSFASASQQVGQNQLRRLRPLRDQRLIKRYLQAIERGEAHGWHTLVYGLVLSLYFLPLRQGLLSYTQQTTLGFISAAAGSLSLSKAQCADLLAEIQTGTPAAINALLAVQTDPPFQIS